jgi:hypothetical protein
VQGPLGIGGNGRGGDNGALGSSVLGQELDFNAGLPGMGLPGFGGNGASPFNPGLNSQRKMSVLNAMAGGNHHMMGGGHNLHALVGSPLASPRAGANIAVNNAGYGGTNLSLGRRLSTLDGGALPGLNLSPRGSMLVRCNSNLHY